MKSASEFNFSESIHLESNEISVDKTENQEMSLVKRLALVTGIANVLADVSEMSVMLEEIMGLVFKNISNCERGVILLRDWKSNAISTRRPALVKFRNNKLNIKGIPISKTIIKHSIKKHECLLINDAADEFDMATSVKENQIQSMIVAPMLFKKAVYGLLIIESGSDQPFTSSDMRTLAMIANLVAAHVKREIEEEKNKELQNQRKKLGAHFSPDHLEVILEQKIDIEEPRERVGPIFFSDIVGFTPLSEKLTALELVDLLNRYYERMGKIIFKYKGTFDKCIGDAIMAHWNMLLDVNHPEHKAIMAGLEMQNDLWLFKQHLLQNNKHTFDVGMGLKSGEVVACNLGPRAKREYTTIGDHVNISSRIESIAPGRCLLVDDETVDKCDFPVIGHALEDTMVKGKSNALTIFIVRGIQSSSDSYLMSIPIIIGDGINGIITSLSDSEMTIWCNYKPQNNQISFKTDLIELDQQIEIKGMIRYNQDLGGYSSISSLQIEHNNSWLKKWIDEEVLELNYSGEVLKTKRKS